MLLGKGIEETLVDVVEASIRSAAAFALSLAMMPTIRAQLMLSGQKWTVVYSQWSVDEGNKVGDESCTESNFHFVKRVEMRGPVFGKARVTPQARRFSGCPVRPVMPAGSDGRMSERGGIGIEDGPALRVERPCRLPPQQPDFLIGPQICGP
jgi:hypothetical protein